MQANCVPSVTMMNVAISFSVLVLYVDASSDNLKTAGTIPLDSIAPTEAPFQTMNALRNYVYGPGRMQPDAAIEKYKERRVRSAQAPVGSTDFDDLAATDSDAKQSDTITITVDTSAQVHGGTGRGWPAEGSLAVRRPPSATAATEAEELAADLIGAGVRVCSAKLPFPPLVGHAILSREPLAHEQRQRRELRAWRSRKAKTTKGTNTLSSFVCLCAC